MLKINQHSGIERCRGDEHARMKSQRKCRRLCSIPHTNHSGQLSLCLLFLPLPFFISVRSQHRHMPFLPFFLSRSFSLSISFSLPFSLPFFILISVFWSLPKPRFFLCRSRLRREFVVVLVVVILPRRRCAGLLRMMRIEGTQDAHSYSRIVIVWRFLALSGRIAIAVRFVGANGDGAAEWRCGARDI